MALNISSWKLDLMGGKIDRRDAAPSVARRVVLMPRPKVPVWLGHTLRGLGLVTLLLVATEKEARAYTDPGTGALIWQMLVAGFVGALFYVRRFVSWIKQKRAGIEPDSSAVRHGERDLEV